MILSRHEQRSATKKGIMEIQTDHNLLIFFPYLIIVMFFFSHDLKIPQAIFHRIIGCNYCRMAITAICHNDVMLIC